VGRIFPRCDILSLTRQNDGVPKIWDESVASHKVRLRAAIIDAAVQLVGERGRGDVPMSAVAERAGIGRATLYNYFPDLDHILAAHVADEFAAHHARLDAELAERPDPLERLSVVVHLTVEYTASARHQISAAVGSLDDFSPGAQHLVDDAVGGFHQRVAAVVAEAVDAGLLRDDLAPSFLAHAVGHLLSAARASVMAGEQPPVEAADAVLSLFLRGAATAKARRRRAGLPGD
jgi:AcrR family transcriptional regulator